MLFPLSCLSRFLSEALCVSSTILQLVFIPSLTQLRHFPQPHPGTAWAVAFRRLPSTLLSLQTRQPTPNQLSSIHSSRRMKKFSSELSLPLPLANVVTYSQAEDQGSLARCCQYLFLLFDSA